MTRREVEENGLLFYWSIESWFLWHLKDATNYRVLWNFPWLLNRRNNEGSGGEANDLNVADGNFYRHLAVSHGGGRQNKLMTGKRSNT